MATLGIDASTSTIGYGVVEDSKIIEIGFLDISKLKTHKEKAFHFINFIKSKPWIGKVKKINIEAALSGFAGGFTSQQVIIMLARWNAVFCYIIEEHYKITPTLANATTMRKKLFGKARIKGMKPKEFVKKEIELRFDLKKWQVKNKIGNIDKRIEDAYDGLVAALY